jgi:hypothetical protein
MAQRLLDRERADATDVDGIAAAGVHLFEKTFAQLAPLLGAAGVEAIFRRSVRSLQNPRPPPPMMVNAFGAGVTRYRASASTNARPKWYAARTPGASASADLPTEGMSAPAKP